MEILDLNAYDIKSNELLYKGIKKNIIAKYLFASINLNDVLEFINQSEELKFRALIRSANIESIIEYLVSKTKTEISNRIKNGEIELVRKKFEPYNAFLNKTQDNYKALTIISNILESLNINNDIESLAEILNIIPTINKVLEPVINENMDKINNRDYNFIKNDPTIINLINIYLKKVEKTTLNKCDVIINYLTNKYDYAKKVKEFLEAHHFGRNAICILLASFNIFEYESLSVSKLANELGITQERIKIYQKTTLEQLFIKDIALDMCKLIPNSKRTYQTLHDWYFFEFTNKRQEPKPLRKKRGSKYTKNLLEILDISKEDLLLIIPRLNPKEQAFIKKEYNTEFDPIDANKISTIYVAGLIKKILIYIENPDVQSTRSYNLAKSLNIAKEEINNILTRLPLSDIKLIYTYYDSELNRNSNKIQQRDIYYLNIIKDSIMKAYDDPNYNPKLEKNICYQLQIEPHTLNNVLIKLTNQDSEYFRLWYDLNGDEIIFPKPNADDKKRISLIIKKIRQLLNINKPKSTDILYNFYNISKQEPDSLIIKLEASDQAFLKLFYDDEYRPINQSGMSQENKSRLRKIKKNIKRFINKPTEKSKRKITLYELLNIEKDLLITLLEQLNDEDKSLIDENYDLDYYRIKRPELSKEEKAKINYRLNLIRKRLKALNSTDEISVKTKTTLYEIIGISKEVLIELIKQLSVNDQELIKVYYDEDFYKFKITNASKEEKNRINSRLCSIRKRIKRMHNDPNFKIRQKRVAKESSKKTLYERLNISKEGLQLLIEKLSDEEKSLLEEHYDEDYLLKKITTSNIEEKKHIRNRLTYIRQKLRRYIKNPPVNEQNAKKNNKSQRASSKKTLCDRINADYNTTTRLILLLSDEEQELILSAFDAQNDYSKRDGANTDLKRINTVIIPKLKRYLANGIKKRKDREVLVPQVNISIKSREEDKLNILELIILMSLSNGENYSTKAIAKYLEMDEAVVIDMIRNYLLTCQEKYNKAVEENLNSLSLTRILKKDEN